MTARAALITGATGAVGPALAHHLAGAGWDVTTLSRHPAPDGLLPPGVRHITANICDEAAVRAAIAEGGVVFHLAALLHIENPGPDLAARYEQVNVGGTRAVARAARDAGAARLVAFSTVKVYGESAYPPLAEDAPTRPQTPYAQTKLDAERAALHVDGLEAVVLRLSPVYGPRLRGSWARLAGAVRRGLFVPVGDLTNRRSLTYVTDVAAAATLAATHPAAAGRTLNLVGEDAATLHDILSALYAAHGRALPRWRLPAGPLVGGLRAADRVLALAGARLPLNPEGIYQLVEDETYDGSALRGLGFTPSVSLETGWQQIVREETR